MQTKPKSNSVVTHRVDPAQPEVIIFSVVGAGPAGDDGKATPAEFALDLRQVSEGNKARGMRHGFIQRIVDKAAIGRDAATGKTANPAIKFSAMKDLADHYNSGADTWAPEREGGGPGLDVMVLAAVAEATGKGVDAVRLMVENGAKAKGLTQRVYLNALAGAKAVAPILARLRAEGAGVDSDAELDALMGEESEADDETQTPE